MSIRTITGATHPYAVRRMKSNKHSTDIMFINAVGKYAFLQIPVQNIFTSLKDWHMSYKLYGRFAAFLFVIMQKPYG